MYQILLLIHGMGAGARPADDPKWYTGLVANLKKFAGRYGHENDFVLKSPTAGKILVVPLTYHQLFDDIRDKWATQAGDSTGWLPLLQQLAFSDPTMLARLPGWVTTAKEFFWTHVLDVLLYRYVAEFTIPIREEVALQMATAWHKADLDNGASTPVHVLSHSLGTAVAHDSICLMATDPGFGPGSHVIETVMTLANVSRVLQTTFPAYSSVDRTANCPPPPGGMTAAALSYRHELDPIPTVNKFDPTGAGWPAAEFTGTVIKDVKDWNVHGLDHYLAHPAAHMRLFERLWPTESWKARMPAAMAAYTAEPATPCPSAIAKVRQDLAAIMGQQHPDTVEEFFDVAVKAVGALRDAAVACDLERGP